MGRVLDAWAHYRVEAEEYRELDDERVLALIRIAGRGKLDFCARSSSAALR